MNLKTTHKKILEPGLHMVTIKDITVVKSDKNQPASWVDPATGQPTGALEILFMGKARFGIEWKVWLAVQSDPALKAFCEAIGIDYKRKTHVDDVYGRKCWIMIAKCLVFQNGQAVMGTDGKQVYQSRIVPRFWKSDDVPTVEGNPQANGGEASGDFLRHWIDGKVVKPIQEEKLPFGE